MFGIKGETKKSARRRFLDSEKLGSSQYIPKSFIYGRRTSWYFNTTISLLIVFHNRNQRTTNSQTRTVRGMEPDGFSCPTCYGNVPAYDAHEIPDVGQEEISR